ncbi:MAG: rRNA methyltransferase [Thermoleophilia bacterium]|nr:rRNA methyltransferase [Thermoleophilia bacterium]
MADHRDERHVFRFFVDAVGAPGATVELDEFDARHARVLHGAHADRPVEVVGSDGAIWHGTFDGPSGRLTLGDAPVACVEEPTIVVLAFVTVGGRTDELVDAAVQAGATRIVPVVRSGKDRAKVDARRERLTRIATTAAKQAKRGSVPTIAAALDPSELANEPAGVIVEPTASQLLDDVIRSLAPDSPIRLLLGSSDGFAPGLVDELVAAGWQRGRLGPTILRAELAAGVAVAIASMHAPR